MTSTTKRLNILFLCPHNSAGSSPRESQQPDTLALEALQQQSTRDLARH